MPNKNNEVKVILSSGYTFEVKNVSCIDIYSSDRVIKLYNKDNRLLAVVPSSSSVVREN